MATEEDEDVLQERAITADEQRLLSAEKQASETCSDSNVHLWTLTVSTPGSCAAFAKKKVDIIALGGEHCLILTKDNQVFSKGVNCHGQLGLGDTEDREQLCLIYQLISIVKIVCGARHSAALDKNGNVFCWGDSRQGQCAQGVKGIFTSPSRVVFTYLSEARLIPPSLPPAEPPLKVKIKQLSSAELFTVAIDTHGRVWSWGTGSGLGLGADRDEALTPCLVRGLRKRCAIQVSCGAFHCVVTTTTESYDNHANIYSPEFRTSSISTHFFADRRLSNGEPLNDTSNRVSFLQNTFYTSGSDHGSVDSVPKIEGPNRSSSNNELQTDPDFNEPTKGLSSSDSNLAQSSPKEVPLDDLPKSQTYGELSNLQNDNDQHLDKQIGYTSSNDMFYSTMQFQGVELVSVVSNKAEKSDSQKDNVDASPDQSMITSSRNTLQDTRTTTSSRIDDIPPLTASLTDVRLEEADGRATSTTTMSTTTTLSSDASSEQTLIIQASSLPDHPDHIEPQQDSHNRSMSSPEEALFTGKKSLFDANQSEIDGRRVSGRPSPRNLRVTEEEDEEDRKLVSDADTNRTEVWSWGKNAYGQLGIGDMKERLEPVLVEKLNGKDVCSIACGAYHSLAITSHCQVYSWGDNTFGQLAHIDSIITRPKKIKVLEGIRVWDIACGRNFSLFLGDTEKNRSDVYFCGEAEIEKSGRSLSNPVIEIVSPDKRKSGRWKRSNKSKNRDGSGQPACVNIEIRKVVHFEKNELIRSVVANDFSFACVTERLDGSSDLEPIYKLAQMERVFYHQLISIETFLLQPLIQTDSWLTITKSPGGDALLPLVDSFTDLVQNVATALHQLSQAIIFSSSFKQLFSHVFSDSLRAVYDRYSRCYSDCMAVGHLRSCNKLSLNILSKKKELVKELEKSLSLKHADFESLLKVPLNRVQVYPDTAKRIRAHCKGTGEGEHLSMVIERWDEFMKSIDTRLTSAASTSKFWDDSHTKLVESLKDGRRRVLKSSKSDPLNLARASRLSNHSFILCNDVFVHVQYNRNFRVFPLITLWATAIPDADALHNAIKVTTPEESSVLVAGTPDGKIAWLMELNQSIANCLSASSSHSLGAAAVNSLSGLLTAAVAREATYTYVNHLQYRTATYSGMWLSGQPHGRGKLSWPDGTYYEGEFVQGAFQGFGVMSWPAATLGASADKVYEGDWQEGKMCGYGKMRYPDGDEYIGHFEDDVRSGHGTLKSLVPSGHSLNTVYVGDWENDVRSGYGVLDFIVRGEKYMGMWSMDERHGYGIVVTVDGVYYEGKFFQNRLVGQGILLSDDDTCYEGEFTADMLLNGKGTLTLSNGDYIDGIFYGKWGEGIKVNGTFSKFANVFPSSITGEVSTDTRLSDFSIDADTKWKCLFHECLLAMGGTKDSGYEIESQVAWKNVRDAVMRASASACSVGGMFGEGLPSETDLVGLQAFLNNALDTTGHPLNILVNGLCEVYSATYVGVGAHRRLLPHAVAEAKSYVSRLFSVLRVLFPGLHDEQYVMLTTDTYDGVASLPVNSMSLLHPLLLPRLYPPLFTLYALSTEKTDAVYTERLHYLNKRGDIALMSFLGVDRKFWLNPDEQTLQPTTPNERAYMSAITSLEEISTAYSPMGKIDIIKKCVANIEKEVSDFWSGSEKLVSMDDLFPVFQYVVVRARVPHLGSEICFIEDMVEPDILVGEAGHRVTTLRACYFQIQNEKDRD